jgi:hypothetical protein
MKNDASPMDTDLSESSTKVPNNYLQFGGMELGLFTPYKPRKVVNLKKFKYDRTTRRIVKQHIMHLPGIRGTPLAVLT